MSTEFQRRVLELTNQERAKSGLGPLTYDSRLNVAADQYSATMANGDFFAHTGLDGSTPTSRANAVGFPGGVAENIGAGYISPEAAVQGWMNSPGHRANILNPTYKSLGVGYFYLANDTGNENWQHYWTQNFGLADGDGGAPQDIQGSSGGGDTSISVNPKPPKLNNSDRGPQTGIQPGFNGPYFDYTDNDDQISLVSKPQGTAIVRGLSGHDVIQGSGDRDDVNGNAGMDTIRGGAGNDDVLRGGKGSDFIDGETGDDAVNGNNDNDTVWGGVGDDWVRGGKDDDVLLGNAGNDRLVGDLGQDWLTGGEGNDVFALRCDAPAVAASVDLADVVLDFQTGDQIGLNDGKTFADLTLESISLSIDNISVDSTAIRLANGSYIGVIQGVLPSALPASVFMDATSFA